MNGVCLGLDLGGTKVALATSSDRRWRHRWPPPAGLSADVGALASWCEQASCDAPVLAVGAAIPATLDRDGRVATWPSRPHWAGFPLLEFLSTVFPGATIRWGDDGNLAALAEARQSGYADLAYLGVGTGIGGGLVLDGVVRPRLAGGCELGHLVVDLRGPVCTCGRQGCVQAIASGPATLRRAELARGQAVTAGELADGFVRSEDWAVATVTESARALAAVVISLTELLTIGLVRIGGGFASALACLVPAVRAETARLGRAGHPPARVETAVLGADSSLSGALLLSRESA